MAPRTLATFVLALAVVLVLGSFIVFLVLSEATDPFPVSKARTAVTPLRVPAAGDVPQAPLPSQPAEETSGDISSAPALPPAHPAAEPLPIACSPLAIRGVVTTEDGQPIPGAVVARLRWPSLREPEVVRLEECATDEQGYYVFEQVMTQCLLEARAPGVFPERRPAAPGTRHDFSLGPAGGFVGQVRDEDGEAVEGALVALTPDTPAGSTTWKKVYRLASCAEARTDERGVFDFGGLRPERYRVRVHPVDRTALGREDMIVEVRQGEVAQCDYTVARGGEVTGRVVTRDGRIPLPGALVFLSEGFMGQNGPIGGLQHRATTDLGGNFRIRGVPPGRNQLFARAAGYRDPAGVLFLFDVAVGGKHEIEVHLERCPVVRGRVVAAEGTALAAARVSTSASGLRYWSDRVVVTDEQGQFALSIASPGKSVRIYAVASGYAISESGAVSIAAGREGWAEIRLGRPAALRGTVVDAEGRAIAEARLKLEPRARASIEGHARSDEAGRFAMADMPEGVYDLQVDCVTRIAERQFEQRLVENVALRAGEEMELRVCVQRGGWIEGRVTTEDGQPLAGAEISARPSGAFLDPGGRATVAEETGRFRIQGLASGKAMDVVVTKPRYGSASIEGVKPPVEGMLIRVPRQRVILTGVVVHDADGTPADTFCVHGIGPPHKGSRMHQRFRHDHSRSDGSFAVDLSLGEWTLHAATGDGLRSRPVTILCRAESPEPRVALRLLAGAALEGVVTDAAGNPVVRSGVWLAMRPAVDIPHGMVRVMTDNAGCWRARGLEEGEHWVGASHADWCPAEPVRESALVGPTSPVRLRLRAWGACAVRVETRDREKSAHPTVTLSRADGQDPVSPRLFYRYEAIHRVGTTDSRGSVTFSRIVPGAYTVEVQQGDRAKRTNVSVLEGETAVVEIAF
ncbi:MAG: carboxypeptidase regulatory-like domain-containing protein [Planctomycetes bacterium]|nr:carboxypeptidase regulatory-like domain-containing protein [Planctomycetota bacterium]